MFDLIKGLPIFLSLPAYFLSSAVWACAIPSNDARFSFVLKDVPVSLEIWEEGRVVAVVGLKFENHPSAILSSSVWGTGRNNGWRVKVVRSTPNILEFGPLLFPGAITADDVKNGRTVVVTQVYAHRRDGLALQSPDFACD
jgi:hypothetical protein